jgi:thiamine-triphosphatase
MANLTRTIHLEVERKFAGLTTSTLHKRGGIPHFRSLQYVGQQTFRDIYFDRHDMLSGNGLWLRQRNGEWQMKIRKGGDRVNSKFQETSDVNAITTAVQSVSSKTVRAENCFGLRVLADIPFTRQTWIADTDFKVVLDQTEFGHTVGEVELEVELDREDEDRAQSVMHEMDSRIAQFLNRYRWAFSDAAPVGKLSAYFQCGCKQS